MLPVTAPLHRGSIGENVKILHDNLLWLIEHGLLVLSVPELLDRLPAEMDKFIYGNATEAIVQELKEHLDITLTPGISSLEAEEINSYLKANVLSAAVRIHGLISSPSGRPIRNAVVKLYEVEFRTETEVLSTLSSEDGYYTFEYGPFAPEDPRKGIKVEAILDDESASVKSELVFNLSAQIQIDLIVDAADTVDTIDEYTIINRKLTDALDGISYGELVLSDAAYLSRETGENEELVKHYINAKSYNAYLATLSVTVATSALYALLRVGNFPTIEAVFNTSRPTLIGILKKAVAINIIPLLSDPAIHLIVEALTEASLLKVVESEGGSVDEARLHSLLSIVLDTNTKIEQFLGYYYSNSNKGEIFWDADAITGVVDIDENGVKSLRRLFVYSMVAGNNPGMVMRMMGNEPKHYAGISIASWLSEIDLAQTAYSAFFQLPSMIPDDDVEAYAQYMKQNVDASYQNIAANKSLTSEDTGVFPNTFQFLDTFIENNPQFNILNSPTSNLTEDYNITGIADPEGFKNELNIFQRLSVVTSNYEVIQTLAQNGLTSASDIVEMSQQDFTTNFAAAFGSNAGASLAYSNALTTVMVSQAAAMGMYQLLSFEIPSIYTLPSEANPDWRSLFGNVDYCSCDHCLSVFSPSAYFVDTLELLRKYNSSAYSWLQKKRPDLFNLLLTCKNTNTSLPYIDLVNELLEDIAIAAGASPSSNPLYPIVAHNTTLNEKNLRAIPEYIKSVITSNYPTTASTTAYHRLKAAKYPWTAPYNYFLDQVNEFLNLITIKPYQISQAFTHVADSYSLPHIDLACSYLNIAKDDSSPVEDEYTILKDTNTTTNIQQYYGVDGATIVNPANRSADITVPGNLVSATPGSEFLNRVDIFLQQTKLSLTDLLELLDCYYINPVTSSSPSVVRALGLQPSPTSACDLSKMIISGLSLNDLVRIHSFVRLWRKTGWTKYELDRVFFSLGITNASFIDDNIIIAIAQYKRLTELMNCNPDDLLPFYNDIPYLQYSSYSGDRPQPLKTQYEQLFRNPSVVPGFNDDTNYPFLENFLTWKNAAGPFSAIDKTKLDYVLAALQISEQEFDYLIAFFENHAALQGIFTTTAGVLEFSYSNVLNLLRETRLSKIMGATVAEWCYYRAWMAQSPAIDPYSLDANGYLTDLFTFVSSIGVIRSSNLRTDVLAYLFEDVFSDSNSKTRVRENLFNAYKDLKIQLTKLNTPITIIPGVDVKEIYEKFLLIFDQDDADFVVNIVGNLSQVEPSTPPFTSDEETRFNNLLPSDLSAAEKLTIVDKLIATQYPPSSPNYETDVNVRLKYINDIYNRSLLKAQTRSFLSNLYKVDTSLVEILLQQTITLIAKVNYNVLINEDFIQGVEEADVNEPYSTEVLMVLELIYKASQLLNNWTLNAEELNNLLSYHSDLNIPDLVNLPVGNCWGVSPSPTPVSYNLLSSLLRWMQLRDEMSPTSIPLLRIIKDSVQAATISAMELKEVWFNAMLDVMQIPVADMEALIGPIATTTASGALLIDFSSGNPHLVAENYFNVAAAVALRAELQVNMSTCVVIAGAVKYAEDQAAADVVVQAVKSRYSNEDWLTQIKPVSDRLRVKRRNALTEYLLANPPLAYRSAWLTSNDIYETLLIDTEMMPIVQTSRIKQAISSVQLFVNRCLLQKEYDGSNTLLTLSADTVSQWNMWRKWYRIWEANRKIFVYPENWIEPDLRDDKSPIFMELEKYLKQNEITNDTMEDAYRTYLERLDDIAHLEVIGYYLEKIYLTTNALSDTVVHVWGRGRSNPQLYYYRKRVDGIWSAWKKMETQIDGDKFAPVMWRGRLRLFWLVFTEQIQEKRSAIKVDEETEHPDKYWKIELCWTELKNGTWTAKQIGKEWVETEPYNAWRIVDLRYNYGYATSWAPNMKPYTLKTFKDSFQFLRDSIIPYAQINTNGELEIILVGRKKYIAQDQLNSYMDQKIPYAAELRVRINSPFNSYTESAKNGFRNELASLYNDNHMIQYTEEYYGYVPQYELFKARFTIKHNKVHVDRNSIPYTFYDSLIENHPYQPTESHYSYQVAKAQGYEHLINNNATLNTVKLIQSAPDFNNAPSLGKYLTFYRQIPDGNNGAYIPFPKFFYKDYRNAFFVEEVYVEEKIEAEFELPSGISSTVDGVFAGIDLSGGLRVDTGGALSGTFSSSYETAIDLNDRGVLFGNGTLQLDFEPLKMMTRKYRFYPFYHYRTNELLNQLNVKGIKGLFDWTFVNDMSTTKDEIDFDTVYDPTAEVIQYYPGAVQNADNDLYPKSTLGFAYDHPFAVYNWELFFHIPMLIANRLMQDQKFFEAMEWYHLVFNPTNKPGTSHGNGPERFWQFFPFYKESKRGIPDIITIMQSPDLQKAVTRWANNPFKPHLVARTRFGAYMKNVLMKYLDNLIEWGDQLFRRDTMESINEATLLYVLAAQLLGRRPVKIPATTTSASYSYTTLLGNGAAMNAFSNALVPIQTMLAPTMSSQSFTIASANPATMFYFCIPPNEKLLGYWDIVADRLFKIRNSQSIDGVERQLALFEPPIDPALLVKAAASGISLSDAINEMFAPLPAYRFNVMSQKATELTQEVKSLGGALLAALEKKDAESISLLRSSHELALMEAVKEVRILQLQEAQAQIAVLQDQKALVAIRLSHYQNLLSKGLNSFEQSQLDSLMASIPLRISEGVLRTLSGIFYAYPNIKLSSPFSLGATYGGTNIGNLMSAGANAISNVAIVNEVRGTMAGIKAGHARRTEDWTLQSKSAEHEIRQIDKQIIAAEIRKALAERELSNHELQMKNSQEMDQAMHDKYTNEELYDWMIGEISLTYFQAYKLAFDVAKRAERCYLFEINTEPATPFIQFGYWDSLKKGLLAGDMLAHDIKRMEVSYLEQNRRQHELTKHISLATYFPEGLQELRLGKSIQFQLPEWIFDMDYPGHYLRRIKSVSLSIPCVAGPYTTVSAKLSLNSSKYRKKTTGGSGYAEVSGNDSRFTYLPGGGQSIATSSAQNDSGMFELNFRDERYLPFEGMGVIGDWSLDLPAKYASYDKATISDVIMHINYTAKYDGGGFKDDVIDYVDDIVGAALPENLKRVFSLKHEFAEDYHQAFLSIVDMGGGENGRKISFTLNHRHFPIFCNGKTINIKEVKVAVIPSAGNTNSYNSRRTIGGSNFGLDASNDFLNSISIVTETINAGADLNMDVFLYRTGDTMAATELKDWYLILDYEIA